MLIITKVTKVRIVVSSLIILIIIITIIITIICDSLSMTTLILEIVN